MVVVATAHDLLCNDKKRNEIFERQSFFWTRERNAYKHNKGEPLFEAKSWLRIETDSNCLDVEQKMAAVSIIDFLFFVLEELNAFTHSQENPLFETKTGVLLY